MKIEKKTTPQELCGRIKIGKKSIPQNRKNTLFVKIEKKNYSSKSETNIMP